MDFKESKTFANLMTAFSGESQARNKYTFYAKKAKEDGFVHIQRIFEDTVRNEEAHAKLWFKLLNGGEIGPTAANLGDAADGEHYEWSDMYASFAATAKEEGFDRIAFLFSGVADIEREHEKRFRKYLAEMEKGLVFKKAEKTVWKCENCGYEYTGENAPDICPICGRKREYFAPAETVIK